MQQCILMVDDRPENLIALEAILDGPDRQLLKANSGEEALRMLLRHEVALVLLDVQMPGMDGFEVAELMRNNRKTQNIPIIFVTAISKEQRYVFRGYEVGAVDYLPKPIDRVILESKVKVFLELDRQRKELELALAEVRALKERNDQLLSAAGEGIVGLDALGMATFANPAAIDILGLAHNAVLGKNIVELLAIKDDVAQWSGSELYKECSKGHSYERRKGVSVRGSERLLSFVATPINDRNSIFTGAVLVLRTVVASADDDPEELAKRQRRHLRKKIPGVIRVFDRANGMTVGRLENISEEGLKLVCKEAVPEHSRFKFSMVLPSPIAGSSTLSFDGLTMWCRQSSYSSDFHVGFQIHQIGDSDSRILMELLGQY